MTYDEIIKRLEYLMLVQELRPNLDIVIDLIKDLKALDKHAKDSVRILDEIQKTRCEVIDARNDIIVEIKKLTKGY